MDSVNISAIKHCSHKLYSTTLMGVMQYYIPVKACLIWLYLHVCALLKYIVMEDTPAIEATKGTMLRDAALTAGAFLIFLSLYILMQLFLPFAVMEEPVEFEITTGMTFRGVTKTLIAKDLVRDTNLFIAMGRLSGLHRRVMPGVYSFSGQVSPWNVFRTVRMGKVKLWQVTLLEGGMLAGIENRLAVDHLVPPDEFNRLKANPRFLGKLEIQAPTLEGYLFPDTYKFARGLSPEKVLELMVRRTRVVLTSEIMDKAASLGLDENGVLTLASIIEKEARLDSERTVISAVYHNRLKKGMRLQADPTVVYGLEAGTIGNYGVRYHDLKRDHPYNTYIIKGLPPGPIASPSLKSIQAAVAPADVPYIFFVSNNDGTHVFTETFKEHQKAVESFREKRAITRRELRSRQK